MKIDITASGSVLSAAIAGNLDTSTANEFYEEVVSAIGDTVTDVVVDLGSVEYISSKGLRSLVRLYKQVGDGRFKVVNANAAVERVINMSGLSQRFGLEQGSVPRSS